jgi:hypothetical protein
VSEEPLNYEFIAGEENALFTTLFHAKFSEATENILLLLKLCFYGLTIGVCSSSNTSEL